MTSPTPRDHGGGIDAACARWGGRPEDWLDLSTGINPVPYPIPALAPSAWTRLPDRGAELALIQAARAHWRVPDGVDILPAPGASAVIARLPMLRPAGQVHIENPTYNEHEAAFRAHGWALSKKDADAVVLVNPNNPDGRTWPPTAADAPLVVIDESFCDISPEASLIDLARRPGTVVLKSFGKFWGLAGLRLGFAIGTGDTIGPLRDALGPWPCSGPALTIGTAALRDQNWASETRARLQSDAGRLDTLLNPLGTIIGGTPLFRLLETPQASVLQERLARNHIWTRTFPYAPNWIRFGLPAVTGWGRLADALR
ncbi:MAG: threonine-phosphate decarboxylase [Pseudomonadota bacterium]